MTMLVPAPGHASAGNNSTESGSPCVLSVVVPTFRRPLLLRHCLTALRTQSFDHGRYEVIIVDDGHDEETRREVAQARSALPAIRYLRTPRPQSGPAVARNIGWKAAHSTLIAFTDDDCEPSFRWLEHGVAAFRDAQVAGAWGRIVVPLPAEPTDHERNTAGLEQAPCATANCFYRKQALEEVGGFDERFTAAWREDSDVQFSLLERRKSLIPVPDAVVVHPVRPAGWGVSVRQQRNNLFNALLFKKHPELYRRFIQASPPWHYYANAAALAAAVVGWLLGWLWLAGPSLALWSADVWRFTAVRLHRTSRRARHVAEMLVTSALIPPIAVYWRLRGSLRYRVLFF